MRARPHKPTSSFTVGFLLFLTVAAVSGGAAAFERPTWEQLVFEQKSFWATARGVLTLSDMPAPAGATDALGAAADNDVRGRLSLEVNNYVASNSEQIMMTLDADTGATRFRWRLSRGRESRVKIHDYRDTFIARERREPPAPDTAVSPADWPTSHEMDVTLPPAADGRHLVATHALMVLLPTLMADPGAADNYLLHTDLNFFRLEASVSDKPVTVDTEIVIDGESARRERACRVLTLRVQPLPGNPEGEDFMLMGMSGKIHIFIDSGTGLPLRLRGDAPRIGRAELNLIEATLRHGAGPRQPAAAP
jgi:hypothetical protein